MENDDRSGREEGDLLGQVLCTALVPIETRLPTCYFNTHREKRAHRNI